MKQIPAKKVPGLNPFFDWTIWHGLQVACSSMADLKLIWWKKFLFGCFSKICLFHSCFSMLCKAIKGIFRDTLMFPLFHFHIVYVCSRPETLTKLHPELFSNPVLFRGPLLPVSLLISGTPPSAIYQTPPLPALYPLLPPWCNYLLFTLICDNGGLELCDVFFAVNWEVRVF